MNKITFAHAWESVYRFADFVDGFLCVGFCIPRKAIIMADSGKYYWLQLHKDFFKRHDIKILKQMDNGEKYVTFYLQLLCESISHEGELRFSETIPYNDKMLATITDTDIDVVRSAMKVLTELRMVELFDDDTLYMTECEKLIGKKVTSAERTRKYRERKALELEQLEECDVTSLSPYNSNSISLSNSISIYSKNNGKNIPPTIEEVVEYCKEKNNGIDGEYFWNYYETRNWKLNKVKMSNWHSAVATWVKNEKERQKPQISKGISGVDAWEKAGRKQND